MLIEKKENWKNNRPYPKLYLDYPLGETPWPMVYEGSHEPIIIYDAEGFPLVRQKRAIGFDLYIED